MSILLMLNFKEIVGQSPPARFTNRPPTITREEIKSQTMPTVIGINASYVRVDYADIFDIDDFSQVNQM